VVENSMALAQKSFSIKQIESEFFSILAATS
jgi:hypothetical protein